MDKLIEKMQIDMANISNWLNEFQQTFVQKAIAEGSTPPVADVTWRLLNNDVTLNEMYAMYCKASEELELQKRVNERINVQLKAASEINNMLACQCDTLITENAFMEKSLLKGKLDQFSVEDPEFGDSIEALTLKIQLMYEGLQLLIRDAGEFVIRHGIAFYDDADSEDVTDNDIDGGTDEGPDGNGDSNANNNTGAVHNTNGNDNGANPYAIASIGISSVNHILNQFYGSINATNKATPTKNDNN